MKLKTIALFAGAAILVLGVPFLGSKILTFVSEREWSQAQAEAKASGLPLTVEEVLKDYQPGPDTDNAAEGLKDIYRRLIMPHRPELLEFQAPMHPQYKAASDTLYRNLESFFEPGSEKDWKTLQQTADTYKEPLADLPGALGRPNWFYGRDWSQGAAMRFPDILHHKTMARVLHAKALVAARGGDWGTATKEVEAILNLGFHLQTELAYICVIKGIECQQEAYQTALDIARLGSMPHSAQLEAQRILNRRPSPIDLRQVWLVGHLSNINAMKLLLTQEGLEELGLKRKDGFAPVSRRRYLRAKSEILRLLIKAEAEWRADAYNRQTAENIADRYDREILAKFKDFDEVLELLSARSALEEVPDIRDCAEAHRRLAYLALLIATQPSGKWKLPPEASQPAWFDPFSGKSMLLKTNANGFVLYSVGPNGVDDGGSLETDSNDDPLDIVVSFPSR